ncbi:MULTISPECIES: DUF937 domain-containing protein [Croceibacter]|jgi:hypothetical protein|uniref:DUF937 domain-containing protein n=1 Tax=Croceibacter atlanticus (strain ATCC BAA-628 / JCM 21780 / CIP 108009 / IAM 15332 / KCTC 12090 / HTCC2559) TaxID=216432 RepID=A3UBU2_CROAH|nr:MULTISPECIES: DUF937 domain-containing protein [Croceibacter]EAP86093.1 hypothetical protein CA2559_08671 [Croceibacter atlanticus HTCC2559]MAM22629.1 DUF937 domain-containing protein [Croceibacter sp.]MBG24691.1 DUF937 domain-containing protein [Croceibacter sp.]WSP33770.1 DUF937 domain-containing protein [Croceibacter atlanticus]|tara:strand:+ start:12544 stop:13176 length:633 start_codon:yes stop_codon:yes gene_type:complete
MASILDLLNTDIGKQLISSASEKTNTSPDRTASVLSSAMPLILGAMKRNAATPDGAASLNSALENNKHDGSLLDNLGGLLSGGGLDDLMSDGGGILGHVLGGKQERVEQTISKTSGVDAGSVGQIIKMAAPIIMGILGSQKRKDNVSQNGLGDLLGSVLGSQSTNDQSLIETLLDADGDGSVIDDVAGMVLGGNKKKGGLGGMLGGLFGK